MTLALSIARLAARILPARHHVWGEAMTAEVAAIDNPRDALLFAAGCLWAALTERVTFVKAFVFAGRLGVALVTSLYGLSFLYFLSNGLRHETPPSHLAILISWQGAMGLSHLAAAGLLLLWRPKPFLWACAAAAISAIALPVFYVVDMIAGKIPPNVTVPVIAWAWPLVPLVILMGAAWLFAWLEQEPKKPAIA